MHPCGHSNIKYFGHVTLRLRIHFSYLNQPSVSKRWSFINLCTHPSPFRHSGKLLRQSPFRCIHIVFKIHLCSDRWISKEKTGNYSFSKVCWLFGQPISLFFIIILFFLYFFQSISSSKRIRNSLQIRHSWYPRLHFIEKGHATESTQDLHFFVQTNHCKVNTTTC